MAMMSFHGRVCCGLDSLASPEPVPYANLANPQSLNLYSYVLNNPVTATDPDGHWCLFGWGTTCTNVAPKKLPVKEGGVAATGALDAAADASAAAADSTFTAAISSAAEAAGNFIASSPVGLLLGAALSQTGGDPILMAKEREAEGTGAQDKPHARVAPFAPRAKQARKVADNPSQAGRPAPGKVKDAAPAGWGSRGASVAASTLAERKRVARRSRAGPRASQ